MECKASPVRHRGRARAMQLCCHLPQGFGHLCKGFDVSIDIDSVLKGATRFDETRMTIHGFSEFFEMVGGLDQVRFDAVERFHEHVHPLKDASTLA